MASTSSSMDSSASSFNLHKHLKEQFVSNLTGSSMLEIFSLAFILSGILIVRRAVGFSYIEGSDFVYGSVKKNDDRDVCSKNWRAYAATMAVDFLFIIVPFILVLTVLAEWTHVLAMLMLLVILYILFCRYKCSTSTRSLESTESLRNSISFFRVVTMIVTCLCILAVDFRIFPRKYAKTETFGTSWMDIGVGSFVVANALVSRQARNVSSMNWRSGLWSTFPLILLGFGRLISTAGVDYQVHVGEYGVHWNFFFTLAAVSLLTSTINISPKYCGILGLIILLGYQICLMQGLNVYLLSNERGTDIVSQNKEGIFSIFGYWGMYLVSVQLSYYLFFTHSSASTSLSVQYTGNKVWVVSLIFWFLTIILEKYVERVSRRMCNLPYVSLVLAVNFQALTMAMLSDLVLGPKFTVLEQAFNRNLLGSFLLANVLTGLVNLSVDTIFTSKTQAFLILAAYAFSLCFFVGLADFYGVKLKFW